MAATYLDATVRKKVSLARKAAIFRVLLLRSQGPLDKQDYSKFLPLTSEEVKKIEKQFTS